jgi:hypothetical protein
MISSVLLLISVASSGTAVPTPESSVERFCAVYVKQKEYGLLEGANRRAMASLLSKRLLRQLDDAQACQKDWFRQQPKGSTDKPPFVDCCLFSSVPDGMPTSYRVGRSQALPEGRYEVVIDYVRKTKTDDIRWRDAVIVHTEDGRFVIDDVIYDIDAAPPRKPLLLSNEFTECRDGRWVGPI